MPSRRRRCPTFRGREKKPNAILASREFNTSAAPSLRDQIIALLYRWLDRMLAHVAAFGSRSPWIGPLIEWGLGGIACALLLVWAFRTVRRQRVRMQMDAARRIEQTDERVLNWMREAEEHASVGRFRDAVHCLYWASIVTLEGRRLWQPGSRAHATRVSAAARSGLSRLRLCFAARLSALRRSGMGCVRRRARTTTALCELHRQLRSA